MPVFHMSPSSRFVSYCFECNREICALAPYWFVNRTEQYFLSCWYWYLFLLAYNRYTSLVVVGVSVGLVPRSEIFQSPDSQATAMMPWLTFSLISMYRRSMCRFPSVIIDSFAQSRAFLLSVTVRVGRSSGQFSAESTPFSRAISC